MKKKDLKKIPGERIRWQYFTQCLLIYLLTAFALLLMTVTRLFAEPSYDLRTWLADLGDGMFTILFFAFPGFLLAVLNRLFFGRIVCVLNDEGLHHRGGSIRWDEIDSVSYIVEMLGRHEYCRVRITGKNLDLELDHAPLYMLRKLKRYIPDAKVGVGKGSVKTVCVGVAVVLAIAVAVMLLP